MATLAGHGGGSEPPPPPPPSTHADTGGDPQRAATQANRLVAQRVAGLVSIGDTRSTAATSEQTERIGMLFVDGGGSANFLSERGMDWYFRTGPSDRLLGEQLLSLLQRTGNGTARKLAIVHSGDSSGTDMSVALEGLAQEGGYTVVADVAAPGQGRGAAEVAGEIRDAAPDAVLAATTQPADSSALLGGFRAIGAAGSVEPRNVRAALVGLQVPGRDTIMPWNGIRFDESGQNTQAAAVVEQLSQAGARVVFPPEL